MTKRLPTRPRSAGYWLILPLLAVGILASACGGGSTKASTASQSTTTTTASGGASAQRADFAKYTSCLEAHGVPASDVNQGFGGRRNGAPGSSSSPSTATPPTTTAAEASARAACRADLPTGGFGGFGRSGGFGNSTADKVYLQCLEAHGVTVPSTPTTVAGSTATTVARGTGGGFANNPAFQAARQACASLLPAGAGGGSTTSTTAP